VIVAAERTGTRAVTGARGAYIDALAETGVGMVCILDRQGRIVAFDEGCERATGFRADEVVGRDARDVVIPPDEADAFAEFLDDVWETGHSSPQVGHWLTRDGELRLISWSNRPIASADGTVRELFTVGIDLTERERANAELQAVHEELARRLYELEQLAEEQSRLRKVSLLVAGEAPPVVIFDAVAGEIARLLDVDTATVVRYEDDGAATVVGTHGNVDAPGFATGSRIALTDDSAVARVFRSGEPARIESYEDLDGTVSTVMRAHGYRTAAAAPVTVVGRLWGAVVVVAADEDALAHDVTERRLGAFAQLVSLAIASADAREQLLASRKRLVQVGDEERRRLERDLHDGAQQRLVTLAQRLYLAQKYLASDVDATAKQLEICVTEVREAIDDLRRLAQGLHPPVLREAGLRPALWALAGRSHVPVTLGDFEDDRFSPEIEVAAYFMVSEALANVAKHARAESARIDVKRVGGCLVVQVADDGGGGANPSRGSGLAGLVDRVEAVGGSLAITSTHAGTTLRAEFPLA